MIYAGTIVDICNKKTYVFTMGLEVVTIKTKKEYFVGQKITFRKGDLYRDWYLSYPSLGLAAVALIVALILGFNSLESRFFQSQNATRLNTTSQGDSQPVDVLEKEELDAEKTEDEKLTDTTTKTVEKDVNQEAEEESLKEKEETKVEVKEEKPVVKAETFSPALAVSNSDSSITFDWNQLSSDSITYNGVQYSGFQFYKVVASETNPNPTYPEDGYLVYITDKSDSDWTVIPANKDYNMSPKLESGKTYYVAITYVFDNGKFSSEVKTIQVPAYTDVQVEKKTEKKTETPSSPAATVSDFHISVGVEGASLKFSWTPLSGSSVSYNGNTYSNFHYYKVVASTTNSAPKYPDDGYLTYITDYNQAAWTLTPSTDSYNQSPALVSGTTYYFSITYVFENGKLYSDTVTCQVP